MPFDRRLMNELRKLDRHDLRRALIFVRGLLHAQGDDAEASPDDGPAVTFRSESVRCGRAGCKTCPHGPYWYAYYREGTKLRSRYIGRDLPEGVKEVLSGKEIPSSAD
jgi:hypothetical protein